MHHTTDLTTRQKRTFFPAHQIFNTSFSRSDILAFVLTTAERGQNINRRYQEQDKSETPPDV